MKHQKEFTLNGGGWGGLRVKAGRKRRKSSGVSHLTRESISINNPLHINLKILHPIRNSLGVQALRNSIANARQSMNIIHYSLESNHIHLIAEAESKQHLYRGMKSFSSTFARILNKGPIQEERYHLHVLKTPVEVKNTYRYVLLNHAHHTKTNSIRSNSYNSLYMCDLKDLSQKWKISIVQEKIRNPIELDYPSSWLGNQY